jgi:hypothetical protein
VNAGAVQNRGFEFAINYTDNFWSRVLICAPREVYVD